MQATPKAWFGGIAAMIVMAALSGVVRAEDEPTGPTPEQLKAAAEAATPGAGHEQLKPLVGSWTYKVKFWMDPSQPPMESTGTIEREWVLGGRFLEETVKGVGPDGKPFEGRGLVGYDNAQQKYTLAWNCTMTTGTSTGEGEFDADKKQFTFETEFYCPIFKEDLAGREVVRLESDDKTVIESYITHDGQEIKIMELVATRKE